MNYTLLRTLPLFEGVAAPQGNLSGGQIQKFVVDDPVTSLI